VASPGFPEIRVIPLAKNHQLQYELTQHEPLDYGHTEICPMHYSHAETALNMIVFLGT
jgi:hypothetical protein